MEKTVEKARRLAGRIDVPGDKSVSHRALLFGAIAGGKTRIENLSGGGDVRSTRTCLEALGVLISEEKGTVLVSGRGADGLRKPAGVLDAGNSGTTLRLLSGILAGRPFESVITGDDSLKKRPMKRIIDPLVEMGAKITSGEGGRAPLTIKGGKLRPIAFRSPVPSAQVKSCVLLAGLSARGETSVEEPALSRDHTERMLGSFGVDVRREGLRVSVRGPVSLKACDIRVPGDISSAAFFLAAGSLVRDSELILPGVGVNPTRAGILDVIRMMGGRVCLSNAYESGGEPIADMEVEASDLKAVMIEGEMIPRVIDEIPVIAVMASQAHGTTVIRDAGELRYKETDRIRAVSENLRRMGAEVEEKEDGMIVHGPQSLKGAVIDSFGDHRIAMAFAVAGLAASGVTVIRDAGCVEISFPGFFEKLGGACRG